MKAIQLRQTVVQELLERICAHQGTVNPIVLAGYILVAYSMEVYDVKYIKTLICECRRRHDLDVRYILKAAYRHLSDKTTPEATKLLLQLVKVYDRSNLAINELRLNTAFLDLGEYGKKIYNLWKYVKTYPVLYSQISESDNLDMDAVAMVLSEKYGLLDELPKKVFADNCEKQGKMSIEEYFRVASEYLGFHFEFPCDHERLCTLEIFKEIDMYLKEVLNVTLPSLPNATVKLHAGLSES
jgi:hypothetical protein